MDDKHYRTFALVASCALLLWYFLHHGETADSNVPENMGEDNDSVQYPSLIDQSYAANPGGFMPGNININGNISSPAYLSRSYTPIFGFGQGFN